MKKTDGRPSVFSLNRITKHSRILFYALCPHLKTNRVM